MPGVYLNESLTGMIVCDNIGFSDGGACVELNTTIIAGVSHTIEVRVLDSKLYIYVDGHEVYTPGSVLDSVQRELNQNTIHDHVS